MTTSTILLLKQKLVELEGWLHPFWKLEMSMMYIGPLYFHRYITALILEPQKSMIFKN